MAPNNKKPRKDGIDYHGKYPFKGTLTADGKVTCSECKSHRGMKNGHHYIASHISCKHKKDAAYRKDQSKYSGVTYQCSCGYKRSVWNNFLAHIRARHGFKGNSTAIKEQGYYAPNAPATQKQQQMSKSTEVDEQVVKKEEWEESDFDIGDIPDDHHPHQDPEDDDKDGGRGPGGAANGLIQAAA
ncbi:uncharacterized protein PG986_001492 [Apiospora aurea]|uniref:C2H2-type domain-containing protein n=1 Tax=Apiospora aurea TaxID=335848 RepID=A0ABR1QYR1_9PEZI